ncbi:hypothetical protein [Moraxella lacunata]
MFSIANTKGRHVLKTEKSSALKNLIHECHQACFDSRQINPKKQMNQS